MIGAYLVGALPMGYWISRWAGVADIRQYGSGNIGATNVARVLGLKYFVVVFAADCLKAYGYLTWCMGEGSSSLPLIGCAFLLLVGNGYSLFLNGSGGKGVATMVGILFALHPLLLIGLFASWAMVLWYLRNVGIASVLTAFASPWYALLFAGARGFLLIAGMALWVIWRHRENIRIYYMVR